MTRPLVPALVCVYITSAISASAQAMWLVPSFGTSVVFDDNVFNRPAAEGDLSVRFSPRLDARRESERLTLTGGVELGADRFVEHPELTTARGREAATVDARYAASRRWSLSGTAAFTETDTPGDLNELTALTPGRLRARRVLVHPSAAYDLGPLAVATAGYLVTADSLNGGVSVTTETASVSIDRHMSARNAVRVEYLEQHFQFGTGETSASRAVTGEWTRTRRATTLTLRAGPRVTSGVLAPDITASARRTLRAGSVSLDYQQTQTTLVGLAGIARTRSVTATAERTVSSQVTLRVTSGIVDARQGDLPSRSYRVTGECDWRLARTLALNVSYDANRQRGNPYLAAPAEIIGRHLVTVKLIVAESAAWMPGR